MEYQELVQLIGSVGFPIVAACAMFYLYYRTVTDITTTLTELRVAIEELKEKVAQLGYQLYSWFCRGHGRERFILSRAHATRTW